VIWPQNSDQCVDDPCLPDPCLGENMLPEGCQQTDLDQYICLCEEGYEWTGQACQAACTDADRDGYGEGLGCVDADCDDTRPDVNPGAEEVCDGRDNNCNQQEDEGFDNLGQACDGEDQDLCTNGTYTCTVDGLDVECVNESIEDIADICDNLDNDCDGTTDEDYISGGSVSYDGGPNAADAGKFKDETCGTGLCAGGTVVCNSEGDGLTCSSLESIAEDICDDLDNDCDGTTDQDFANGGSVSYDGGPNAADAGKFKGEACGTGLCTDGQVICSSDHLSLTCSSLDNIADDICDDLDNDCDGTTDEDFAGGGSISYDGGPYAPDAGKFKDDTCGTGLCADGQVICSSDHLSLTCSSLENIADDICDELDNDCDGTTDDDFISGGSTTYDGGPYVGDAGKFKGEVCGTGDCVDGQVVCSGDHLSLTCSTLVNISSEACDSQDNDCDGLQDEDFPTLGEVCTNGIGECQREGNLVCNATQDGVVCDAVEGLPSAEVCDGLDNNCDNSVDETFPTLNQACDGADSDLCENGTYTCMADGTNVECVNESIVDITETCDGSDEDCDGSIDEDFPTLGNACDGNDSDLCENGTFTCRADGSDVECVNEAIVDITETCDGSDEDCDGSIDEDFPLLGTVCDGADSDLCPNGTYTCTADGSGVECVNESIVDITETCDGSDEDCDGSIDEDFPLLGTPCDGADSDQCTNGTYTCTADGSGVECVNESIVDITEVCNGVDDDCDGPIDEDFPTLGDICDGADSDLCENGTLTCTADGLTVECVNESIVDITETCDGSDEDCDGSIDENFPSLGNACDGADSDLCENGTYTCTADGAGVECVNESIVDITETCDGSDEDCDGSIDEDFPLLGTACDGADSDLCANGTYTCTADGSTVECVNESIVDIVDICNGADDDCDGSIDEDFPTLGDICDGLDSDLCENGTLTCTADGSGVECINESVVDIIDICNSADDDCDGSIDEDFPTLGDVCDGADSDLCENGTLTCTVDGLGVECVNETIEDIIDTCNGLDDDCDGLTDENYPSLGSACDGADSDLCENGTYTCTAAGWGVECVNETIEDISELCNAADDDCDGATDEGFSIGLACDGADSDVCEFGTWTCTGDQLGSECINETLEDIPPQYSCDPCSHSACDTGLMMWSNCSSCIGSICAADPYCCDTDWDALCVSEVRTVCGSLTCPDSTGTCSHSPCDSNGAATPLVSGCDAAQADCVSQICAVDPFCCTTDWDFLCVGEVETVCGNNCILPD
jgi:hypothetical protein